MHCNINLTQTSNFIYGTYTKLQTFMTLTWQWVKGIQVYTECINTKMKIKAENTSKLILMYTEQLGTIRMH